MHSIAEIGTNIPAFLAKLWKIVEDPETNDLISWNESGCSFIIKDENRFSRELLPMYYKHNNMASFIRQLNIYGFHKIVSPGSGSMNLDALDEIEFSHPFFIRGHSYLLDNIKRKMTVRGPNELGERANSQVLGKVMTDVKQMKGRQENIDSKLTAMKLENGALWRELSVLRQKHLKQQQMVNKLIQFLVTLVHQNPNMFSMKRKYPRMLQQIDGHKMSKRDQRQVDDSASNCTNSPTGPIIHELDPAEALLEDVVEEAEGEEIDDEPMSPSQVSQYFLNESNEDVEDPIVGFPFTVPSDKHVETIIGMPEDTLIMSPNNSKQKNSTKNIIYIPKELSKQQKVLIPKHSVNIVPSKANSDVDLQKRIYETQQRLIKNQLHAKQDLRHQIEKNQQEIQKNQEQINRTKELKRNQQQILKSQQFVLKNQQKVLKDYQEKIKSDEQWLNNGQQTDTDAVNLQRNEPKMFQGNQQQSKRSKQLQKNQQQISQKRQRKPQVSKGLSQQSQKSPHLELQNSQYVEMQKSPYVVVQKSPYIEVQKSPYVVVQTSPYVEVQKSPYVELKKSPYVELPKSPDRLQQLQVNLNNENQQKVQSGTEIIQLNDNSSVETILGMVDGPGGEVCEFTEAAAPDYRLPVVAVHPHPEMQDQQASPAVPQDLMISSPAVVTPRSSTVTSPLVSAPSPCSSNMQVARIDGSQVTSPNLMTSAEMGNHVDTMQSDLESLKELLQSEGISLDANTLLGCFNEDPLSFSISDPGGLLPDDPNKPRENSGSELMAYNPSLLDLTDLMGSEWSLPSPSEAQAADDSFGEIHTPQFVPSSPSFPVPAKRRKK